MSWKSDHHGLVFKSNEIKLYAPGHTWQMKLGQHLFSENTIRIITYTLPTILYLKHLFARRSHDIWIVAHRHAARQALEIKKVYPDLQIALHPSVHSKVALISPKTLYISSANLGYNGQAFSDQRRAQWHETSVGIRTEEAHDWYTQHVFQPLWEKSQPLPHPSSEDFLQESIQLLRESPRRRFGR